MTGAEQPDEPELGPGPDPGLDGAEVAATPPTGGLRRRLLTAVRAGFVLAAVGLGVAAIARDLDGFRAALATIGASRAAAALALVVVGLLVSAEVWRTSVVPVTGALTRPASRAIFFVSQLGKYIPGGLWTIAAQVDLARRYGLRRSAMGVGALLYLGFHVATGVVVAAVLVPLGTPGLLREQAWVPVVGVLSVIGLLPPVLDRVVRLGLKVLRQPPLPAPLTARDIARPVGWLVVVWAAFGLATYVVAAPLVAAEPAAAGSAVGGPAATLLVLSVGGFALAWVVGVLVLPAPAGVGAREVALVLALAPVLSVTQATSVAVVLRVAHAVADLGLAAVLRPRRR